MSDFFKTLSSPAEGIYKDKMSKFLSFAHPVETAEEAKEIIKAYQKKYFDARHVCWAYMIGTSRTEFLSNDNGEPSGTAGKPILGQINSFELTNIVIVEAIRNGQIIECHEQTQVEFCFPYLSMNDVMKVIKNNNLTIVEQIFDNTCKMTIEINADEAELFRHKLADIDGVSVL